MYKWVTLYKCFIMYYQSALYLNGVVLECCNECDRCRRKKANCYPHRMLGIFVGQSATRTARGYAGEGTRDGPC